MHLDRRSVRPFAGPDGTVSSVFNFPIGPRRELRVQPADGDSRSFWPSTRVRRPLDVGRLMLSASALTVLVVLGCLDVALIRSFTDLVPTVVSGFPRSVVSVANVALSISVLAVLVAIAVDALRFRRLSVTCAGIACALAILVNLGLGGLIDALAGHDVMNSVTGPAGDSAGLPITALLALLVGADLHRRPWWVTARLTVTAVVASALVLGTLTIPSTAYALLIGATAGFAVRVATGVFPARPSDEVVRSVLSGAGFELTHLEPLEQIAGRIRYTGIGPHIGEARVTVIDPDRGGVPFVRRGWRLLRLRTAVVGKPALTLRGQLERQALTAALATSAGVPAPEVLALLPAGSALLLLERTLAGTSMAVATDSEAAAGAIPAFVALRRLHAAGLALGAMSVEHIVLLPDDRVGFAEFGSAQPASTELQRALDVVNLLVAVATRTGPEAAVAALRSVHDKGPTMENRLAALVQPVVLSRPLRTAVRRTPLLGDLRKAITGPGGPTNISGIPRLQRLSGRTIISVVGGTIAVYLLATQLSQVSIGAALRSASPGWLAVAVLGSAVTYVGSALALKAFVATKLPLLRTTVVQLAASFVALVTPPAVGHVGLNIRYLQKSGVPTAVAAAEVAVKEVVTVVITVPLLLVCGWLSGASGSRLALLPSGNVLVILAVTAGVLGLIALAPPSRRVLRRRIEPMLRRILPEVIAALSDPKRLATAVIGVLILNGGYVLALDASLRAFSTSLALPTLVVVYLAASTLGSVAPTPGGLGAVEAALVGGLTATGVPVAAAITAVLAFRTATFWLPAPLGWGAFVALQRRSRI